MVGAAGLCGSARPGPRSMRLRLCRLRPVKGGDPDGIRPHDSRARGRRVDWLTPPGLQNWWAWENLHLHGFLHGSEARASSRFATCPEDLERVKRVELPLQPWPGCMPTCYASLEKLASASDSASNRACLKGRALECPSHSRTENWYPVLVSRQLLSVIDRSLCF